MLDNFIITLDAPGEAVSKLQVAKLGSFTDPRYGGFEITAEQVQRWKDNLGVLPGGKAPIDLDHRSEKSGPERSTEAAGWIEDVNLVDGRAVADVTWTTLGKQAIDEQRYLFFSPAFGKHRVEGVTYDDVLAGGALTNKPFLNMPTIQLADEANVARALLENVTAEDSLMLLLDVDADERKLALKEGNSLPDGSYPIRNVAQLHAAAILAASGHGDAAAAKKLIARRAKELGVTLGTLPGFSSEKKTMDSPAAMELTQQIAEAIGVPADADEKTVLDALTALRAPATPETEPDKVSLDAAAAAEGKIVLDAESYTQLRANAEAGAEAKRLLDEQTFDIAFKDAMGKGKAVPAQREHFAHFYSLDHEGTLKMLDDLPVAVNMTARGGDHQNFVDAAPSNVHEGSFQLDVAVRQRIAEKGYNPETDYKKALDELYAEGKAGVS